MSRTIAIVEDDQAIRENYIDLLKRQGYVVKGYADRQSAEMAFNLSYLLSKNQLKWHGTKEGLVQFLSSVLEVEPNLVQTKDNGT